ncbi:MAG: hypothetical protein HDT02_01590 [Bacteroidales bacterium]|nr:hypothetical protein [Bacteroidales bacterium]
MINRILIRIKVVQILYSYLLVEKQFHLESLSGTPTKEKRYAYALYLDMLVLLIRVARNLERRRNEYPLADTRFISRLLIDDRIKSIMLKYSSSPFPLEAAVEPLTEAIAESGIYKSYLKAVDRGDMAAQESLWQDLIRMVVMPSPALSPLFEAREMYTLKSVARTEELLLETVRNFLSSQDNIEEVVRSLESSLDKARELYCRLLQLPVELTQMQDIIIDRNRHKHLPTEEDINPNMRFVENRAVRVLENDEMLLGYLKQNKVSWRQEYPIMMDDLLGQITRSELYREYMSLPAPEGETPEERERIRMHEDAEFWRNVFKKIIFPNTHFLETMEEQSVFWNDDLDIIGTFVLKTLKRIEDGEIRPLLDKYKDDEDARFGAELMRAVYKGKDTYRRWISEALSVSSWESDRLAFMDVVIMETALAEIMNFPKIPLRVSINEYIEMAKSYSTSASGSFIHGLLGGIVSRLQKEGLLRK